MNGRLASLGVRTKILAAVLVAIAATVITCGIGISEIRSVSDNGQALYDRGLVPTREVGTIRELVWKARWAAIKLTDSTTPAAVTTYTDLWNSTNSLLDNAVTAYQQNNLSTAQIASIKSFQKNWALYLSYRVKAKQVLIADGKEAYTAFGLKYTNVAIDAAVVDLDALTSASGSLSTTLLKHNKDVLRRAEILVVAALIVGAGLAFGLALLVASGITRPLNRVKKVLTAVAAGDLTGHADVTSGDEIGQMASSLSEATERMRAAVTMIAASSISLGHRATDLQSASTELSTSAEQTAQRTGGISGAVAEVSSGIQAVATGAEEMGASIREISVNAQQAAQVASSAVAVSGETQQLMVGLGVSTDDISRRVATIQADARRAVESIGGVTEVIGKIDDFQSTIASAVEEQSATTQGMASDLSATASGIDQIGQSMADVTAAAESTLTTARNTSAAAHELAILSTDLMSAVEIFRV